MHSVICRICSSTCNMVAEVEGNHVLRAIAEIAERLSVVVDEHGPSAVAMCRGTRGIGSSSFTVPMATAFMNPADLAEADESVKRGLVSMTHCFGGIPEFDHEVRAIGSNTNRLTWTDDGYGRYAGQPRMSAVPVAVRVYDDLSLDAPVTA